MDVEAIKKDITDVKTRARTGRIMAHVIANYDDLREMNGWEIVYLLGIKASNYPDVAKAKAAAKQLIDMGYSTGKKA